MAMDMTTKENKEKKYIGKCCGNSFIILDCRNPGYLSKKEKRKFAIENINKHKVDSALFLEKSKDGNTFIDIFEQDGSESDSCGNGSILTAYLLGIDKGKAEMKNNVLTIEGCAEKQSILMNMKSLEIKEIKNEKKCVYVKFGEPHVVFMVDDLKKFNLERIGKKFQNNYHKGVNVNAIQKKDDYHYLIETYERGVFAKTKSCGTGSLSAYAAVSHFNNQQYKQPIEFKSIGGIHWVSRKNNMLKLETLKKFCKIKIL